MVVDANGEQVRLTTGGIYYNVGGDSAIDPLHTDICCGSIFPGEVHILCHRWFSIEAPTSKVRRGDPTLFAAPGQYKVNASYSFGAGRSDSWQGTLESDEIQLEIIPGQQSEALDDAEHAVESTRETPDPSGSGSAGKSGRRSWREVVEGVENVQPSPDLQAQIAAQTRDVIRGLPELVHPDLIVEIPSEAQDWLVAMQPTSGDELLRIIADADDPLNRRATNALHSIWQSLSPSQIGAYFTMSWDRQDQPHRDR